MKRLLLVSALLCLGCHRDPVILEGSRARVIRSIGQQEDVNAPDFFGRLYDIRMDHEKNVYLLDVTAGEVRAFTWEGTYLGRYGNGIGDGPGEIRRAVSICLDDSGNVYMAEDSTTKINVFSPNGQFLATIQAPFILTALAATDRNHIYLSRSVSVNSPRLVLFSPTTGITQEAIPPDSYTELVIASGFYWMIDRLGDHIVIERSYPYVITLLGKDLSILHEWQGQPGVLETEPYRQEDRRVHWDSMLYNVVAGRDSLIYVVSGEKIGDTGRLAGVIDVYSWEGLARARINVDELGYSWFCTFVVDENHVMVAAVEEPFPSAVWLDLNPWVTPKRIN